MLAHKVAMIRGSTTAGVPFDGMAHFLAGLEHRQGGYTIAEMAIPMSIMAKLRAMPAHGVDYILLTDQEHDYLSTVVKGMKFLMADQIAIDFGNTVFSAAVVVVDPDHPWAESAATEEAS